MTSPDMEAVRAIARLSSEHDFGVFVEWLKLATDDAIHYLLNVADAHMMAEARAEAALLRELVDMIESAPGIVRGGLNTSVMADGRPQTGGSGTSAIGEHPKGLTNRGAGQ
jgi:hypothetical protein